MDYGKVTNARYGGLNTSAANEGLGGTPPPLPSTLPSQILGMPLFTTKFFRLMT